MVCRGLGRSKEPERKDAMSSVLDVIGSCYQGHQPAHTDHPLRHFDRTCPACIAEGQPEKGERLPPHVLQAIKEGPALTSPLDNAARRYGKKRETDEEFATRIALLAVSASAPHSDVLAQVEAALRKNPLIAMFLDQRFWHAHHVDMVIRYNGKDERFEADWIKDIWYVVVRRGLTATQAVRAEQVGTASGAVDRRGA
jgi:hypothetical protein